MSLDYLLLSFLLFLFYFQRFLRRKVLLARAMMEDHADALMTVCRPGRGESEERGGGKLGPMMSISITPRINSCRLPGLSSTNGLQPLKGHFHLSLTIWNFTSSGLAAYFLHDSQGHACINPPNHPSPLSYELTALIFPPPKRAHTHTHTCQGIIHRGSSTLGLHTAKPAGF